MSARYAYRLKMRSVYTEESYTSMSCRYDFTNVKGDIRIQVTIKYSVYKTHYINICSKAL